METEDTGITMAHPASSCQLVIASTKVCELWILSHEKELLGYFQTSPKTKLFDIQLGKTKVKEVPP